MYYHVWFITKYRRPVLLEKVDKKIKAIFAECIQRHGYNVLEIETNIDHVHMLVKAKSKQDLSGLVRTIKAVSARELLRNTPLFRGGNGKVGGKGHFWARRYGYREIRRNEIEGVRKYVRNQKKYPTLPNGKRYPHSSEWGMQETTRGSVWRA
ncbi:MAG: IS200/IS605 family transposase [Candidatus Omnitrophota bacterium]